MCHIYLHFCLQKIPVMPYKKKVHDKDASVNQTLNGVDILEIVLRTNKDIIF